jgi:Cd2+/Zn2+-exporting ATPase
MNIRQFFSKTRNEMQAESIQAQITFNKILITILLCALLFSVFKIFSHGIIQNILIAVSIVAVIPLLLNALSALVKRRITIDMLASIALVFTFIKGEWFSAAFINLMLSSARLFDAYTQRRTKHIIERLLKLRPSKVKVKEGDVIREVGLESVKVGDLVIIEPGDRIPIDGIVVFGQASIDQSTLTGESERVTKKIGDKIFSSTLNDSGSLVVRAEKVGEDTTLSKIIAMVGEASRAKTKIENIADRFSTWYVILSLAGSLAIYIFSRNLDLVLSILLVTCADDIAVAIPLGFTVAISKAAKHGIVVKGALILEKVRNVKYIVTDKTGTLTKASLKVIDVVPFGGESEEKLEEIMGMCAIDSKHAVSLAVLRFLKEKNINPKSSIDFSEIPGDGMVIHSGGRKFISGKLEFLEKNGVVLTDKEKEEIASIQEKGMSLTFYAEDKKLIGLISLEDEIKRFAKESIEETKEMGVKKWIMLTGDNEKVASKVSGTLGIEEYYANLKPEDKLHKIKKLEKEHHGQLAMMGDGVNDAAALALADVSFAMGGIGSDASIEAADITLMHDDLRRVPEAMLLSRKALEIVRQNFAIWAFTNVLGLVLVFYGFIGPVGASAYNFLTDFLPIINVFQIYFLRINKHTYDELVN